MINSKKKGFTIVELVIVIAVVAILAAVLIPTFSNLVKKANLSADQVAVKNMNTALAVESKPEDIESAVKLLDEAGYNAFEALIPVSKGYTFYWMVSNNTIVLADENLKVVFPSNLKDEDLTDDIAAGEAYNLKGGYVVDAPANAETLLDAIYNGQSVALTQDITLDQPLYVKKGDTVKIDLGGKELKVAESTNKDTDGVSIKSACALEIYGNVVIENGTISSRGIMVRAGGNLQIGSGVTINAIDNGGGFAINCQGGEVIIDGATINVLEGDETVDPLDAITTDPSAIKITAGKITIKNGTFNTLKTAQYAFRVEGGELVVENCEVTAWRGCVSATGGNAIINGGKYTANGNGGGWVFYAAGNGNITINGGTFTNNDSASRFFTTEGNGKITDNTNK